MASQTMRLDTSRLAELRRALILDSSPERAYDDITRLLATALAVPITMVNLLDAERDWFKSCVGIQQTQTQTQTQTQSQSQSPAVTSFCEVFFSSTHDLIVVEDTLLDPQFQSHPKVSGDPFIRFYAAARLTVRGQTVGTLCACDTRPRQLAPEQLDHLRALASAAADLIARRSAPTDRLSAER